MGKITITIEAASLEEAQEMMRVKACAPISYAEACEAIHAPDWSRSVTYSSGLDPEHSSIPKPTAPTEQPATEPSAPIAGVQTSAEPVSDQVEVPPANPATLVGVRETVSSVPAIEPSTQTGSEVELDSDGLPWDSRIHSSSRKKLAKTQQWKKARGVDADLVARVEAELRQAMAIPNPKRETPATTAGGQDTPMASAVTAAEPVAAPSPSVFAESDAAAAFAPPPPAQESEVPKPAGPSSEDAAQSVALTTLQAPQPLEPASSAAAASPIPDNAPKTLAELNALVLGAGMQLADVLPAVQEVGLASYALLGTRPDLIPEVARKLGLGG